VQPSLQTEFEDESDEDSIFIPFADLFSLLSVTVIYVVLTFGQTVPGTSQPVVAATLQGTGPGKPIDPTSVYVSLREVSGTVQFIVERNGTTWDQTVPIAGAETRVPEIWLKETIARGSEPSMVYVFLPESEKSIVVKALSTDTQRFLRAHFRNVRFAYDF
jgi:hypothetical protein